MKTMSRGLWALVLAWLPMLALAEDGHDLWLRYRPLQGSALAQLQAGARAVVPLAGGAGAPASATLNAAVAELQRGIAGMAGRTPPQRPRPVAGALLLATPATAPAGVDLPWAELGREGYALRRTTSVSYTHLTLPTICSV